MTWSGNSRPHGTRVRGRAELREGYAIVLTDGVGPHFVTAIWILDSAETGEPQENS